MCWSVLGKVPKLDPHCDQPMFLISWTNLATERPNIYRNSSTLAKHASVHILKRVELSIDIVLDIEFMEHSDITNAPVGKEHYAHSHVTKSVHHGGTLMCSSSINYDDVNSSQRARSSFPMFLLVHVCATTLTLAAIMESPDCGASTTSNAIHQVTTAFLLY